MNSKDVLMIALAPIHDKGDGVANKVKMQVRGMTKNGRSAQLLAYDEKGPALYEIVDDDFKVIKQLPNNNKLRWKSLFEDVKLLLLDYSYKKVYIRYPRSTGSLVKALKILKESGAEITLEIPTYPLHFDKPSGLKDFVVKVLYSMSEIVYSKKLKKYVSQIYEVGPEVEKVYGIPAKAIPNGVDEKAYPLRTPDAPGDDIHIILSSNFYRHHGIDRLIAGLGNYVKAGGKDVFLELVGEGPECAHCKKQAEDLGIGDFVTFHGYMSGEPYDELYNHCQVASSCLGFVRMGYDVASPLKSREYMLRGIPYIYCYGEIGLDADFKYAKRIVEEDGPIDINFVKDFYNTYKFNQEKAGEEMREYSLKTFTWNSILKDI